MTEKLILFGSSTKKWKSIQYGGGWLDQEQVGELGSADTLCTHRHTLTFYIQR